MEDAETTAADRPARGAAAAGFAISLASIVACGFLSLPGLAVSLMGLRRGPRGLAAAGVAISIATGLGWGLALLHVQRALDDLMRPTLASAVWTRAEEVVAEARNRREAEPDGQAAESTWRGSGTQEAVITARWSRMDDGGATRVEAFAPRPPKEGVGDGAVIDATVVILADGTAVLTPEAFAAWALAPFDDPLPGSGAAVGGELLQAGVELYLEAFAAASKAILAEADRVGRLPADAEGQAMLESIAWPIRRIRTGGKESTIGVSSHRYRDLAEDRFELLLGLEIAGAGPVEAPSMAAVTTLRGGEIVLPQR